MKSKRWMYLTMLALAAPAAFWTSFEAYGLTLFESQMLFFSISHAFPAILIVVLISALFFLLLALLNVVCLFSQRLCASLRVPRSLVGSMLLFQVLHLVALFSYEAWTSNSVVRVALSLVGLGLLIFTFIRAAAWLAVAQQGAQEGRAKESHAS